MNSADRGSDRPTPEPGVVARLWARGGIWRSLLIASVLTTATLLLVPSHPVHTRVKCSVGSATAPSVVPGPVATPVVPPAAPGPVLTTARLAAPTLSEIPPAIAVLRPPATTAPRFAPRFLPPPYMSKMTRAAVMEADTTVPATRS